MQFIEVSDWGVRSAFYDVRSPSSSLEYRLFPMWHVATRAFYAEVQQRLTARDYVLVEGVRSRRALGLAWHRLLKRSRHLDLAHQGEALNLAALPGRVILADMPGDEFDARWDAVPLKEGLLIVPLAWLYGGVLALFGTRWALAHLAGDVTDLPSRSDIAWLGDPLFDLIAGDRDALLVKTIAAFDAQHRAERGTVAVLYGARHMRSVTELLIGRLKYHVDSAEWVTLFDYG